MNRRDLLKKIIMRVYGKNHPVQPTKIGENPAWKLRPTRAR
mgnify:CR=1 FL=1